MLKLGFALNNLGPNQLAYYLIRNVNEYLLEHSHEVDVIAFYENVSRPCMMPNFAVMQMQEAYSFDGVLISTSLSTAAKAAHFPGPHKHIFYMWDLEWVRAYTNRHYNSVAAIYRNPNTSLITRSASHKKVVEDAWNVAVGNIVDDVNIEKVIQLCQ